MARVEVGAQEFGTIIRNGQPVPNATVQIATLAGPAATHWSAVTGGSSSTANLSTDVDGVVGLAGAPRFIDEGTYNVTSGGTTRRVEAVSGATLVSAESGIGAVFPLSGYASLQAAIDAANAAGGGTVVLPIGATAVSTGLQMKSKVILAGARPQEWSVWAHDTTPSTYHASWLAADGTAGAVVTFGTSVVTAGLRDLLILANGRVGIDAPTSATRGGNRIRNVYVSGGGVNIAQKETRIRDLLVMHAPSDGLTIDASDCSLTGDILVGYSGGKGIVLTTNSSPLRHTGTIDTFYNTTRGMEINGDGHRLLSVQANNNSREGVIFVTATASVIVDLNATDNGREYDGVSNLTRYADLRFAHPSGGNQGCGVIGGVLRSTDAKQSFAVINNETSITFPFLIGLYFSGPYQGGSSPFNMVSSLSQFNVRGCAQVPDHMMPQAAVAPRFRPNGSADMTQWYDGSSTVYAGVKASGAMYERMGTQTLAANGAVTIDASSCNYQRVNLQANATSVSITNPTTGQELTIEFGQDATGSRTVAWPTAKYVGGAAPTTSTTANWSDSVTFRYDGTSWKEIARSVGVR